MTEIDKSNIENAFLDTESLDEDRLATLFKFRHEAIKRKASP
ncbi:hypothetical protein [Litorivivens sp.]